MEKWVRMHNFQMSLFMRCRYHFEWGGLNWGFGVEIVKNKERKNCQRRLWANPNPRSSIHRVILLATWNSKKSHGIMVTQYRSKKKKNSVHPKTLFCKICQLPFICSFWNLEPFQSAYPLLSIWLEFKFLSANMCATNNIYAFRTEELHDRAGIN